MARVYEDNYGLNIIINMGEDISGASGFSLSVKKPNGTIVTWSGANLTVYNTNYLKYLTVAGDLDQIGKYYVQPILTLGTFTGATDIDSFSVDKRLV